MKEQKALRINGLRGRINLSFLLIVALAIVSFMIVSINRSRQAIKDTSIEYTSQLVQMMNENIESYMENMENISNIVIHNSDVRNYLLLEDTEEPYLTKVEEQFATLKETRNDIYNIGILGTAGKYLINDRWTKANPHIDLEELAWYHSVTDGQSYISSSHVQNVVYEEYPWVVTMSCIMSDPDSNEEMGIFFIDLNYGTIRNLAEEVNLGQKGYVFIIDGDQEIVYHPKQQLIYSGLWEEEGLEAVRPAEGLTVREANNKIYTQVRSGVTDWTVVGVTDLDEMLSSTGELITLFYLMAVFLIGFAMLLAVLLTDRITLPLRRLQESMKAVEGGDFEVEPLEEGGSDEIGDLIRTFHMMIAEIKRLIGRITAEQEEKRKSELNALQAQINPHFLYNTLDSIIWMAEGNNSKDVILMTSALARLFRKSISNDREMVSVAEEMEYTRSYLTIQQMRYKGKLSYHIEVEPALQNAGIIKLIVQPLAENAIYHGIKYKKDPGTIQIRAAYRDKGILIQVIDDGQGMDEEQLAHIFDERPSGGSGQGVGVLNVHKRIQLYYGEKYGLTFESIYGEGTTASIWLPDQTGGIHG